MPGDPNKLSRFWQELKRRRVLAIGFPLALIFSWIFDVTPQGLERTEPVENLKNNSTEASHSISKRNRYLGKIINWSLITIPVFVIGAYLIIRSTVDSDLPELVKFSMVLPDEDFLDYNSGSSAVSISPDGKSFVYVSVRNGISSLMLRRLDDFEGTLMIGTKGASSPFFSRDGDWVGFFANGYFKKVSILGGTPLNICETRAGYDGCWIDESSIIFADSYKRCLMTVPSTGGIPKQLTSSTIYIQGATEQHHSRPQVLPGGKEIIYTVIHNSDDVRIAAYSLETGEKRNIVSHGSSGMYVSSGHLIYSWKGDLMAVPFDLKRMKVTGNPAMIIDRVLMDNYSRAHYSISEGGSLIYIPGDIVEPDDRIMLVDTSGESKILDLPLGKYQSPRFSPDGEQLLIGYTLEKSNCWIYELDRGTFRRFTEKDYEAFWAIWTPDGSEIVFNSNLEGSALNLYLKRKGKWYVRF